MQIAMYPVAVLNTRAVRRQLESSVCIIHRPQRK